MPKKTFINLDSEKKERVTTAILNEFLEKNYEKASISNIVRNAKIPKGSFYQYFEDKKDMYIYMLDYIDSKRNEFVANHLSKPESMNFFEIIKDNLLLNYRFYKNNNIYMNVLKNFRDEKDEGFRNEITDYYLKKNNTLFSKKVNFYKEKGLIDEKIDVDILTKVISTIISSIENEYWEKFAGEDENEMEKFINMFIYILENGLKKKEGD